MAEKFSLLSQDEPTDEQLHLITRDALADVFKQSAIGDANLKKLMERASDKYTISQVIAENDGQN